MCRLFLIFCAFITYRVLWYSRRNLNGALKAFYAEHIHISNSVVFRSSTRITSSIEQQTLRGFEDTIEASDSDVLLFNLVEDFITVNSIFCVCR